MANHNKKSDIHLLKFDLKLAFHRNFYPHIKSDIQYIKNEISFEKVFSLDWIQCFTERRCVDITK